MTVLHVCAVQAESRGLPERAERLVTGVGPSSAAARLARRLALGPKVDLVVVSGVAGVLPRPADGDQIAAAARPLDFSLAVGEVVLVRCTALVDEGVVTSNGFVGLRSLGLPCSAIAESHAQLRVDLAREFGLRQVDCATVSTGSGTDDAALAIARRLSEALARRSEPRSAGERVWARSSLAPAELPVVETMESAALALACKDAGVPWIELRAISNRTGDRARGGWDLEAALAALDPIRVRIHEALTTSAWGVPRP